MTMADYYRPAAAKVGSITKRDFVDAVRNESDLDMLTGVYHAGYIEQSLPTAMSRSLEREQALSILSVVMDRSEWIHDRFGRVVSDLVLQHVAQTLQKRARRPGDWVAREDGNAFLICLPGVKYSAALRYANNLRVAIMSERMLFEGDEVSLTCSFGVQTMECNSAPITAHELLRLAQEKAKTALLAGGNAVV
ncbi:MAG: GGDEF domain-containing protein [Eubacteriales bacterium]|nr:GGDEF domain-containing protein [Eubacteriales bacterium]